jgi:DNA-binding NtrC family response regulator
MTELPEDQSAAEAQLAPARSKAMQQILATIDRIAASPRSPLLLLGETGAGKEVLARHLHRKGATDRAPFIHVNCAGLTDVTAESELFGYERGSFADAKLQRRGLVELAHGGTLFLDEIGDLSAPLQAKLLTFLDSGRFRRMGAAVELRSTARVVAATNSDLGAQIQAGRFREDLWFRLSVFKVRVPPLRERPEDLEGLATALLEEIAAELGRGRLRLSTEAVRRLHAHKFPGNVRELKNILERAVVLEEGPVIDLTKLHFADAEVVSPSPDAFVLRGALVTADELERRYVRWVLARLGGKRMVTARLLGMSYPTFLKRLAPG